MEILNSQLGFSFFATNIQESRTYKPDGTIFVSTLGIDCFYELITIVFLRHKVDWMLVCSIIWKSQLQT